MPKIYRTQRLAFFPPPPLKNVRRLQFVSVLVPSLGTPHDDGLEDALVVAAATTAPSALVVLGGVVEVGVGGGALVDGVEDGGDGGVRHSVVEAPAGLFVLL